MNRGTPMSNSEARKKAGEQAAPSMDEFEFTLTRRALRQIKAEAWSEGYHHGVEDMTGTETLDVVRRNPYRVPTEARNA